MVILHRKVKMNHLIIICRQKYDEKLLQEKGIYLQALSCQNSHRHRVVETEWKFHMTRCLDRNKVWSYQLMASQIKNLSLDMLYVTAIRKRKAKREKM